MEVEIGGVAIYRPFGNFTELNCTVTYMVAKANDRRTTTPCHDEFRGPPSDYVRQVALENNNTKGEKYFNDDHREEITDFVQSIRGFQECDEEDVETWMACDAEDCGFQMLNDDEIVTSVREESDPVDDETDEDEGNNNNNESCTGPSNAALETAMECFHAEIVEVEIGGVAIYCPFGEFRRAKSYCHLYGAQGQRQAYPSPMPR
ncbi:uncharacterized protein TNCV_3223321 [Trichonephila clavipes]|nr:uncharacterized protein TNCV_3223321 [Trichonephila clavipes]